MSPSATQDVHLDFADRSDIALVSADGMKFHIASSILMRTSGFFRGMLTVPQPSGDTNEQSIVLAEDALTIEILLKLASGLPAQLERLKSPEEIETVLQAAEKYIPGAVIVLLLALGWAVCSVSGEQDSMRQYAVACRLNGPDLADTFAQKCASVDIDFENVPPIGIQQLAHITRLRQRRIASFVRQVRDFTQGAVFYREANGMCFRCQQEHNNDSWTRFTSEVCLQFALHPSIKTALSQPEVQTEIRQMECASCKFCSRPSYSWNSICRRLYALVL